MPNHEEQMCVCVSNKLTSHNPVPKANSCFGISLSHVFQNNFQDIMANFVFN